MLRYLRADHPDAILDAMCTGPERLNGYYGIDAIPLAWYQKYQHNLLPKGRIGAGSGCVGVWVKILFPGLFVGHPYEG